MSAPQKILMKFMHIVNNLSIHSKSSYVHFILSPHNLVLLLFCTTFRFMNAMDNICNVVFNGFVISQNKMAMLGTIEREWLAIITFIKLKKEASLNPNECTFVCI